MQIAFIIIVQLLISINMPSSQKYLFYIHGKIVEDQGAEAVSPSFGAYQYNDILDTFRKKGFTVKSELRKPNTDIKVFAKYITDQINELLKSGVNAADITVIGASKGAVIAMFVSTYMKNENLNFVFLAACNDGNFEAFPDIRFYGNVLSIYEKSDDIGESCIRFRNKAGNTIHHYKEVEINTGRSHGFLFRPLPEWINPAMKWAEGKYD